MPCKGVAVLQTVPCFGLVTHKPVLGFVEHSIHA